MAKLTDARVAILKGYFNAGDQPTEAQFAVLIAAIQEGIEEHDHDATGDGDGMQLDWDSIWSDAVHDHSAAGEGGATLGFTAMTGAGVDVPDGWYLGIGAALERIIFDAAGNLRVMGADFGVGVTPTLKFDVQEDASGFMAQFFNDGNNIDRHVIKLQGGADNGAAAGTTHYIYASDGDGGVTGNIKTIDGVFQLADASDRRRKTNIKNTALIGLDIVNGLRVRDYNWKRNPKGPVMTSFVAQEAQEVFPSMVGEALDGTLMTSRALLIPILAKAIQELDARLTKGGM